MLWVFLHLSIFFSIFSVCILSAALVLPDFSILIKYNTNDPSNRYGKYNPKYSTKRSTNQHNNEYKKWGKIQWSTHNVRNKKVILYLLYDDIEDSYSECYFPRYSKSNNNCWNESKKGTNIRNKFHNSSNKCEGEGLSCRKSPKCF